MPDRTPVWVRLHLPLPSHEESARAALTSLAGVSGQPLIILEATGHAGQVGWRLGCERWALARVVRALTDQLPGLRHELIEEPLHQLTRADAAARLRFAGDRRLPLNAKYAESAVRGLLGALARAHRRESVTLQLVLGQRRRPGGPVPERSPRRRFIDIKQSEHRVACEVRIGASAADSARVRSLIEGTVGSLRGLEVPGVRLLIHRTSVDRFSRASSPLLWSNVLSISDLLPLTAWPIGDLPLPGVPAAHPRPLPVSFAVPKKGRELGTSRLDADRVVALTESDSLRHLHLLGPTGVGKSTLMAHLALQDIAAGRGVVVVDPKGDLVEDLLRRIPTHRHDDVVVLDGRDRVPVGINGLHQPADPDLAADTLLSVFHSLYAASWGPRTQDILHACLLTLARRGDGSLAFIPLLLTNPGLRRSLVGRVAKADPMGLGAFWGWFEGISDAERQTAIAPLMNKLRPILLRPGIRGIFAQHQPRFDLHQVFTERKVLLVNLAKGQIGSDGAQLLGSLVIALLWSAALRRISTPEAKRHPVMIHIDEVQDYLRLPGDLGDALAQARGLGVGFTLAHQHLGQLPSDLRDAVMANARSRVAFGLSPRDARDLAATTRGQLDAEDFQALPAFQAYAGLLVSGSPTDWLSLSTNPLGPVLQPSASIRQASSARYGLSLDAVEADLLSLLVKPRTDEPLGRVRKNGSSS